jgi:hypothetical protein
MLKNLSTKGIALSMLFFFLPCAYSYPGRAWYWLVKLNDTDNVGSLLHTFLIPTILWALAFLCIRLKDERDSITGELARDWMSLSTLAVWFLAATLSYVINDSTGLAMATYSACYLSFILIYIATRNISISGNDVKLIFMALSIGCLFPLVLGLIAFYKEWGILGAQELLYSRYDIVRMAGYCEATFGNTSNTGPFLLLAGLPLFNISLDREYGKALRIWFTFVLILVVLNLLIIQSRASIITFCISMALIMYHRKVKKEGLILTIGILAIFTLPMLGSLNEFYDNLSAAIFVDKSDNSVYERTTAIAEGWHAFMDNWQFGMGPGSTLSELSLQSAHQFMVQQGAEVGILGFVSSALLSLIVICRALRAAARDHRVPINRQNFTFIVGPFGFIVYALISNAPLCIGVVNTFIGLFTVYLALAERTTLAGRLYSAAIYRQSGYKDERAPGSVPQTALSQ